MIEITMPWPVWFRSECTKRADCAKIFGFAEMAGAIFIEQGAGPLSLRERVRVRVDRL